MESQHHWGWLFLAFCVLGVVTYIFTLNRPDSEKYGKGAFKVEQHRQDWPLSIHVGEGGCAVLDRQRKQK